MSDNKRYCMGCMEEIDSRAAICPHCLYSGDANQHSPYLEQGEMIADRYMVGKVLSTANDSICYIGLDKSTLAKVQICEYYPNKIAHRAIGNNIVGAKEGYSSLYESCLQGFLSLWRRLKAFESISCIPAVTDIVTENGTAYSVSVYKDSMPLKNYFEKIRKPLAYNKAIAAFTPILKALKSLHNAGIIHGNITPSTIQVGSDGRLTLIGFSIPQCRSEINELNTKPVNGFSALEIYETANAKAESDIYSVMAVMYYAVTGTVLPKATDRTENDSLVFPSSVATATPKQVLDIFERALAVYSYNRISDANELLLSLRAAAKQSKNAETPQTKTNVAKSVSKSKTTVQKKQPAKTKTKTTKAKADNKKEDSKEPPLLALGITTCIAMIAMCSVIFCALYTTVLYKNFDIPFLDDLFADVTFLPINSRKNNDETQVFLPTDTVEPSATQTAYATVADFTKLTYDYIISNETFTRNFVFKFKQSPSDTVEKGGIISQNATVGESVPVGTEIILVVSTGIEQIVVTDVLGKSYDEAKKILTESGLNVVKETLENKEGKTPDEVYRMSIDPGQTVDKGTKITLEVWDEVPETTTEPTTEATTKKKAEEKKETTTTKKSSSENKTTTKAEKDE